MTYKNILQQRAIKCSKPKLISKVNIYDILINYIETEQSTKMVDKLNKYVFKVHKDANKLDVKNAFYSFYNIVPKSINIMNVITKGRFNKKIVRRGYKKAIITLKKGDKIELVK